MEYLVLSTCDLDDLIANVNEAIKERGFEPLGGICVVMERNVVETNIVRQYNFYQAMVKKRTNEKKL